MMTLDRHTLIAGDTDTGKTTGARYLFVQSQRCNVFVNTQGEDVPGHEVEGRPPTLQELVQHRKVVWNDDNPARMVDELPRFVDRLFAFGKQVAPSPVNRKAPWCNVHVDEAWRYEKDNAPAGKDPLTRLALQGYRHGVVLVVILQRPQLASKSAVRPCRQVILYNVPVDDRTYIEGMLGEPLSPDDVAWLQQPWHFIVHTARGYERHSPVPVHC